MESSEIEIGLESRALLEPYFGRIEECFDVKLSENGQDESRDQSGAPPHTATTTLRLQAFSSIKIQLAKKFIKSVTAAPSGLCECHLTLSQEDIAHIQTYYYDVEKETQTIFLFRDDAKTVSILGPLESMKMAQSLTTQNLSPVMKGTLQNKASPTPLQERLQKGQPSPGLTVQMGLGGGGGGSGQEGALEGGEHLTLSLSPSAESHDSCYDSDGSPHTSRLDLHDDVSRTVSDTLDAELCDDQNPPKDATTNITSSPPPAPTPPPPSGEARTSNDHSPSSSPGIHAMVKQETLEFSITSLSQRSEEGQEETLSLQNNCTETRIPTPEITTPAVVIISDSKQLGTKTSTVQGGEECKPSPTIGGELEIPTQLASEGREEGGSNSPTPSSQTFPTQVQSPAGHKPTLARARAPSSQGLRDLNFSDLTLEDTGCQKLDMVQMEHTRLGLDRLHAGSGSGSEIGLNEDEDDVQDEKMDLIQFGIKLGYDEELIFKVLEKLGPGVVRNELLNALVHEGGNEKEEETEEVSCPWPLEQVQIQEERVQKSPLTKTMSGASVSSPTNKTSVNRATNSKNNLRPIILDGSNIAMSHGNKEVFSCRGIKLAVDYFRERGHDKLTVFVPAWRKEAPRQDTQIKDQEILYELEKEGVLVFTPSRWCNNKRIVCYDDLYILKVAAEDEGIVVSNDNYRDLVNIEEYKQVIEKRILMYSFVKDRFMPPDDPLGRRGPSLDNFLSKIPDLPEPLPPECPYAKKCTYGNKCKFYHPERGTMPQKSVSERLQEQARAKMPEARRNALSRESSPGENSPRGKSPTPHEKVPAKKALTKTTSHNPVSRTKSPLTRTSSLTPEALRGKQELRATLSASHVESGLQDFSKHGLDSQLLGADTQSECKVTLTKPMPTVDEKRKSYDDILTESRKRVEQAEAAERAKKQLKHVIGDDPERLSLKPPNHWSVAQHETLRATHSDPQNSHYDTESRISCGHLSLAKKLSDEGKKEEERRKSAPFIPGVQLSPTHQQTEEKTHIGGHRPLARQLSLQGSDDPRLHQKLVRTINTQPVQKQHKEKRPPTPSNNKPRYKFHEAPNPRFSIPPRVRTHQEPIHYGVQVRFGSDITSPLHGSSLLHRYPQQKGDRLVDHHQLERQHSYAFQQSAASMAPPDHPPASRMLSAPGTYPIHNGSGITTPTQVPGGVSRSMIRQNSTSDPQLHIPSDNSQNDMNHMPFFSTGGPQWSNGQRIWDEGRDDSWKYNVLQQHHQSQQQRTTEEEEGYDNQRNRTPRDRTSKGFTVSPFPVGYEDIELTHYHSPMTPGMFPTDRNLSPDHKQIMAESNMFINPHASNPREGYILPMAGPTLLGPRTSSPDLYPPRQSSPTSSLPSPNDIYPAGNYMSPTMVPTHSIHQGLPSAGPPPHPEDQKLTNVHHMPTDPRSKLYFHLSALFSESKARLVMQLYPNETSPGKLCEYIMGLRN